VDTARGRWGKADLHGHGQSFLADWADPVLTTGANDLGEDRPMA